MWYNNAKRSEVMIKIIHNPDKEESKLVEDRLYELLAQILVENEDKLEYNDDNTKEET